MAQRRRGRWRGDGEMKKANDTRWKLGRDPPAAPRTGSCSSTWGRHLPSPTSSQSLRRGSSNPGPKPHQSRWRAWSLRQQQPTHHHPGLGPLQPGHLQGISRDVQGSCCWIYTKRGVKQPHFPVGGASPHSPPKGRVHSLRGCYQANNNLLRA